MNKLSRRSFLRSVGMAGAGVALAACAAPAAPAAQDSDGDDMAGDGMTGDLQIWVQHYTPTESMEQGPNNPLPHNMIQVISDEYMADHPGATIEIIRKPDNLASHEWIVTQQAGGTIPHIVWTHSFWTQDEIDKNWWIPLDPFFEQPNPYVAAGDPGSERWLDQFYEIPTEAKRGPDGKHYVVPIDLVTTFFFFNQNVFDEHGLSAPSTYGEWIEVQEALLTTDTIPNARLAWYESQVGAMLYAKKDDIINADGGVASLEEVGCAMKNGLYSATDPEYGDWFRLVKQLIPYLAPDWAAEGADFNRKFLQKDVAVFEDGSWRFGYLKADPLVDFEWSTFYAPTITEADSQYAIGEAAPPIGGATAAQWALATKTERDGIVPLAVDFLRYVTAPQNAGRMISETGTFLPNIKGVDVNPDLKEPLRAITEGLGEAGMVTYPDKIGTEQREKIAAIWTDFKLDVVTQERAAEQINELLLEYADEAIEKNGWDCG